MYTILKSKGKWKWTVGRLLQSEAKRNQYSNEWTAEPVYYHSNIHPNRLDEKLGWNQYSPAVQIWAQWPMYRDLLYRPQLHHRLQGKRS